MSGPNRCWGGCSINTNTWCDAPETSQLCGSQLNDEGPVGSERSFFVFLSPLDKVLSLGFKVFKASQTLWDRNNFARVISPHCVWKFKFLATQWEAEAETSQKPSACVEKFLLPSGGDYQERQRGEEGGALLYLERASMARSQNYQLPFMIIYCTAAQIIQTAQKGCFTFFIKWLWESGPRSRLTFLSEMASGRKNSPLFHNTCSLLWCLSELKLWFLSKHFKPFNIKHQFWF